MSEQARIDSCDDHLDIYHLPPTLWSDRLPAKYKEAGPRVIERDGMKLWMIGDQPLGVSGKIDAYEPYCVSAEMAYTCSMTSFDQPGRNK